MKTALLRRRRPTLAPDWIGFLAFRGSFGLRRTAILAPALFLLGAAAGTNGRVASVSQGRRLLRVIYGGTGPSAESRFMSAHCMI